MVDVCDNDDPLGLALVKKKKVEEWQTALNVIPWDILKNWDYVRLLSAHHFFFL